MNLCDMHFIDIKKKKEKDPAPYRIDARLKVIYIW